MSKITFCQCCGEKFDEPINPADWELKKNIKWKRVLLKLLCWRCAEALCKTWHVFKKPERSGEEHRNS